MDQQETTRDKVIALLLQQKSMKIQEIAKHLQTKVSNSLIHLLSQVAVWTLNPNVLENKVIKLSCNNSCQYCPYVRTSDDPFTSLVICENCQHTVCENCFDQNNNYCKQCLGHYGKFCLVCSTFSFDLQTWQKNKFPMPQEYIKRQKSFPCLCTMCEKGTQVVPIVSFLDIDSFPLNKEKHSFNVILPKFQPSYCQLRAALIDHYGPQFNFKGFYIYAAQETDLNNYVSGEIQLMDLSQGLHILPIPPYEILSIKEKFTLTLKLNNSEQLIDFENLPSEHTTFSSILHLLSAKFPNEFNLFNFEMQQEYFRPDQKACNITFSPHGAFYFHYLHCSLIKSASYLRVRSPETVVIPFPVASAFCLNSRTEEILEKAEKFNRSLKRLKSLRKRHVVVRPYSSPHKTYKKIKQITTRVGKLEKHVLTLCEKLNKA